jgi:hypothetical protein
MNVFSHRLARRSIAYFLEFRDPSAEFILSVPEGPQDDTAIYSLDAGRKEEGSFSLPLH